MTFKYQLCELITLFEQWLIEPKDNIQMEEWKDAANAIIDTYQFREREKECADIIVDMYMEQYAEQVKEQKNDQHINSSLIMAELDELICRKQIEQRTPEWYAQMATTISASEIGNLLSSDYARGSLVLSKCAAPLIRNQQTATLSAFMCAFDWGIRFEPVVKQIYEAKYGAVIKELGRLQHPTVKCSASPDGLVYSCEEKERIGRLVEIKCPVSRRITGQIPKEYYAQMQLQLNVTGRKVCDYVEASFGSIYSNVKNIVAGPGLYCGMIALIRYAEPVNAQEFYYVYSPINVENDWVPDINIDEEIVEMIPWRLMEWSEQTVWHSEEWWNDMLPRINAFWEDVEKARHGDFDAPLSSRANKKPKVDTCKIVFNRLDT
jgi:hypothetical protein